MKCISTKLVAFTGPYDNGITRRYFNEVIEAPDNITAMQIVLGRIMLTIKSPIKLDKIHYECL